MKKTREQKRNELAEQVCREVRWQLSVDGRLDLSKMNEYLVKWMNYAKKNKYIRP